MIDNDEFERGYRTGLLDALAELRHIEDEVIENKGRLLSVPTINMTHAALAWGSRRIVAKIRP